MTIGFKEIVKEHWNALKGDEQVLKGDEEEL